MMKLRESTAEKKITAVAGNVIFIAGRFLDKMIPEVSHMSQNTVTHTSAMTTAAVVGRRWELCA